MLSVQSGSRKLRQNEAHALLTIKSDTTPLWEIDSKFTVQQEECDFQTDWNVEQLNLKFTPPLCNILVQFMTEGVHISCERVQHANPLIHSLYENLQWAIVCF